MRGDTARHEQRSRFRKGIDKGVSPIALANRHHIDKIILADDHRGIKRVSRRGGADILERTPGLLGVTDVQDAGCPVRSGFPCRRSNHQYRDQRKHHQYHHGQLNQSDPG